MRPKSGEMTGNKEKIEVVDDLFEIFSVNYVSLEHLCFFYKLIKQGEVSHTRYLPLSLALFFLNFIFQLNLSGAELFSHISSLSSALHRR